MKPNPHQCQQTNDPQRNFNCTYYDHCLTQAAKGRWDGFTCVPCEFSKSPMDLSSVLEQDQALEIADHAVEGDGLKKGARNLVVSKPRSQHLQQVNRRA